MVSLRAVSVLALLVLRYYFGVIFRTFMQSLGQRYSVAVCVCAFTRASSFTLLSVWGVLCSVQFLVFFKRFLLSFLFDSLV